MMPVMVMPVMIVRGLRTHRWPWIPKRFPQLAKACRTNCDLLGIRQFAIDQKIGTTHSRCLVPSKNNPRVLCARSQRTGTRVCLFRGRAGATIHRRVAQQGRGGRLRCLFKRNTGNQRRDRRGENPSETDVWYRYSCGGNGARKLAQPSLW
jgi:hypothetical protein